MQPAKYYEHLIANYYHNLNYLGKYYLEFYQTTIYRSKFYFEKHFNAISTQNQDFLHNRVSQETK